MFLYQQCHVEGALAIEGSQVAQRRSFTCTSVQDDNRAYQFWNCSKGVVWIQKKSRNQCCGFVFQNGKFDLIFIFVVRISTSAAAAANTASIVICLGLFDLLPPDNLRFIGHEQEVAISLSVIQIISNLKFPEFVHH